LTVTRLIQDPLYVRSINTANAHCSHFFAVKSNGAKN
jgi:hypothetical protein